MSSVSGTIRKRLKSSLFALVNAVREPAGIQRNHSSLSVVLYLNTIWNPCMMTGYGDGKLKGDRYGQRRPQTLLGFVGSCRRSVLVLSLFMDFSAHKPCWGLWDHAGDPSLFLVYSWTSAPTNPVGVCGIMQAIRPVGVCMMDSTAP